MAVFSLSLDHLTAFLAWLPFTVFTGFHLAGSWNGYPITLPCQIFPIIDEIDRLSPDSQVMVKADLENLH